MLLIPTFKCRQNLQCIEFSLAHLSADFLECWIRITTLKKKPNKPTKPPNWLRSWLFSIERWLAHKDKSYNSVKKRTAEIRLFEFTNNLRHIHVSRINFMKVKQRKREIISYKGYDPFPRSESPLFSSGSPQSLLISREWQGNLLQATSHLALLFALRNGRGS